MGQRLSVVGAVLWCLRPRGGNHCARVQEGSRESGEPPNVWGGPGPRFWGAPEARSGNFTEFSPTASEQGGPGPQVGRGLTDLVQGRVVHRVRSHLRKADDEGRGALSVGVAAHGPRGVQQLPFLVWTPGQTGLAGERPPIKKPLSPPPPGVGRPGTEGHMYRQYSPVLSWSL